jgi:hypothetical protein
MGQEVFFRVFSVLIHFGALKNAKYGLNGLIFGSFGKTTEHGVKAQGAKLVRAKKAVGERFFTQKGKYGQTGSLSD